MMKSRWFSYGALSAWVLALAACGGGGSADAPSPARLAQFSHAATAPATVPTSTLLNSAPMVARDAAKPVARSSQAQQAQATAPARSLAQPASPASAFFDWVERTQFEFFPGPQVDRSLPPFVYRYYPSTETYLAVNGDSIYALGPVTGNQVVALGQLSDFACFVSMASCIPAPVGVASATITAPNNGKTPWNLATPVSLTLKDSAGNLVSGALACSSPNTVALSVAEDCSSVTGQRLGSHTITVSGGGVSASATIRVIPQAQPLGTQGATEYHNLVVTSGGKVMAWGGNYDGVLGQGKSASQLPSLSLPTPVKDQTGQGELSGIVAVSAGRGYTALALTENGEVWSWGSTTALGRTASNGDALLPGKVRNAADNGSLSRMVAISIGDDNALALADDGTVYSWGSYTGQTSTSGSGRFPGQVKAVTGTGVLTNVVAVSAGWNWSAALTSDGKVVTWGFQFDSDGSNAGQGVTTSSVIAPGYVLRDSDGAAINDVVAISAGYNFGLALTVGGQIYAWGGNTSGQLGQNKTSGSYARAVLVKGIGGAGHLDNIKMVAAGGLHALALDGEGKVFSWGRATDDQLGDGPNRPFVNESPMPGAVVSEAGIGQLSGVGAIAAGDDYSLALTADGSVLIWGSGGFGNMGQGGTSTADLAVPTKVKDSTGASFLSLAPASIWPNLTRRGR